MMFGTLRSKCALLAALCLLILGASTHAAADSITLAWDPGSGVGYKVHVGVQSGSYSQHFDVGSATLFTFPSAVAGQRYCFTVSAYLLSSRLEGPNSGEVCGYSNAPPTLVNPGNRTSTVGQPVTLQLVGSDPQSQPLTYSATGLPPGLSVQASTGFISGTGTSAGTYSVTARAYDGALSASQTFSWVMTTATGGSDTTPPTIGIGSPTSSTTYTTTSSTIALGGSASDNRGVSQVTWVNNRGGSGAASGTTSWSASIALVSGTNILTVTARDAAGNQATDAITVTYNAPTGGGGSSTTPVITITSPTSSATFTSTSSTVTLRGSATDDQSVTVVGYQNDRGGNGYASGTSSWSVDVRLQPGTNIITVAALDAAGNQGRDVITVTYGTGTPTPPPPPPPTTIALSAQPVISSSWAATRLTWSNAPWSSVDVYRNGMRVTNTANDGSHLDPIWSRGTYSYKICAPGSTTTCSATVTVYY
jgi:hypothetical protein